jgi:hypothetical protein
VEESERVIEGKFDHNTLYALMEILEPNSFAQLIDTDTLSLNTVN